MRKITINGFEVNVIASDISFNGQVWDEIDRYPRLVETRTLHGNHVHDYSDDWVVMGNEDYTLYMNNNEGFMVYVEQEKSHYDEGRGLVIDKRGRILYTTI